MQIKDLKQDKRNYRKHNQQNLDLIKKSVSEVGLGRSVVIDNENEIVCGNGLVSTLDKNTPIKVIETDGTELVVVKRTDLSTNDEKRKQLAIMDNSTSDSSEFDLDSLQADFDVEQLQDWGLDVEFDSLEEQEITEDEVPEEVETKCKLGDIWQLGNHRLMCGDSTSITDVEKLMDGAKADMVFTDPPYGMNAVSKSGVLSKNYKTDILNDSDNQVAIDSFNLVQSLYKDIKQVWWGANYYTECLPSSECWIVWDKNNGASDQTDCELAWANFRSVVRQFTLASEKRNRVHPTQKPVELIKKIFNKFEKENKFINVLDLFGGSGSTLSYCEQTNRKCYMMELDPHYCDVIIQRWENFTGQKAELLNGEQ